MTTEQRITATPEQLERAILGAAISPLQRTILRERFGFNATRTGRTLDEVASDNGLTRVAVRTLEMQALPHVRAQIALG